MKDGRSLAPKKKAELVNQSSGEYLKLGSVNELLLRPQRNATSEPKPCCSPRERRAVGIRSGQWALLSFVERNTTSKFVRGSHTRIRILPFEPASYSGPVRCLRQSGRITSRPAVMSPARGTTKNPTNRLTGLLFGRCRPSYENSDTTPNKSRHRYRY